MQARYIGVLLAVLVAAAAATKIPFGHTVMVDAGSSKCEVFTFQHLKFMHNEPRVPTHEGVDGEEQDLHFPPSEPPVSDKVLKDVEKERHMDGKEDSEAPKPAESGSGEKPAPKAKAESGETDLLEHPTSITLAQELLAASEKAMRSSSLRGGPRTMELLQLSVQLRGAKKKYKCPSGAKSFPGVDKFTGMQEMPKGQGFNIDKVNFHELSLKNGEVTILTAYLQCLLHAANTFFEGYDFEVKEASDVFMRATAGMRLRRLEGDKMKDKVVFLEKVIREFLRRSANVGTSEYAVAPVKEAAVDFFETIPGATEAKYDWLAVNYLKWLESGGKRKEDGSYEGGMDDDVNTAGLGDFLTKNTVGALDLGGASGQVAMELDPTKLKGKERHPDFPHLIKYSDENEWVSSDRIHEFKYNGRAYLLYHQSWLLYGVVEALRRFKFNKGRFAAVKPFGSYCFRKGFIGQEFIGQDASTSHSRFNLCVDTDSNNKAEAGLFSLLDTDPTSEAYAAACPTLYDKDISPLKEEYEDCTFFVSNEMAPKTPAGVPAKPGDALLQVGEGRKRGEGGNGSKETDEADEETRTPATPPALKPTDHGSEDTSEADKEIPKPKPAEDSTNETAEADKEAATTTPPAPKPTDDGSEDTSEADKEAATTTPKPVGDNSEGSESHEETAKSKPKPAEDSAKGSAGENKASGKPRLRAPLKWMLNGDSDFFAIGAGFYFSIQPALRTACKFALAFDGDKTEGEMIIAMMMNDLPERTEAVKEEARDEGNESGDAPPSDDEEAHSEGGEKSHISLLTNHLKGLGIRLDTVVETCNMQLAAAKKIQPIALTVGQLSELAEFYCELPWTPEEQEACSDENAMGCDANVCFKIAYSHTLLKHGYGFDDEMTITFAKKIAGMDAAWVPGAVIDIEATADKERHRVRRVEAMQPAWKTWKQRAEELEAAHNEMKAKKATGEAAGSKEKKVEKATGEAAGSTEVKPPAEKKPPAPKEPKEAKEHASTTAPAKGDGTGLELSEH